MRFHIFVIISCLCSRFHEETSDFFYSIMIFLYTLYTYTVDVVFTLSYGPLSRYGTLRVVHVPGMPGPVFPPPRVSVPDMHHGTCVTHVPWCMPWSLNSGFLSSWRAGKMFPTFLAHAQTPLLCIWQEAHADPNLVVVVHANILPLNGAMHARCWLKYQTSILRLPMIQHTYKYQVASFNMTDEISWNDT